MKMRESAEDYLETILILSKQQDFVRSIDVAKEMELSKPSVSRAVNLLKDNGYLDVATHGHIVLTEKGVVHAERVYERHRLLTQFLIALGVDEKTADDDACRVEHVISEASFAKIKAHAQKLMADTENR